MKIDGGCHCGAIAYEADIDPEMVSICHCTDCQTLSGTSFRVVVFAPEEKFRLTRGAPKAYVKTAESGNRRIQAFCAECGSPIYATSADDGPPKAYSIRLGTARQRDQLPPRRQIWHRSAVTWLPEMEGLATRETT
ncbi:GFA family protein [Mesorhizobium marinum]|uniref:GFA family protein n=1 Tax=Mesorhizobium marinum TaxID=3228790 RepID=A0ABV3R1N0_9HYPH